MMLDPKELFVVSTISRESIAELLSSQVEVDSADARLTADFCNAFAVAYYQMECACLGCDEDAAVEAEEGLIAEFVSRL